MARYLRIYRVFFTSAIARELEFRANFVAKLLQNATWILFYMVLLMVIYRNTSSVAGFGQGEAFILTANCFLMGSIVHAIAGFVSQIPGQVRLGMLDFVLTKPVDSQFWVSLRQFDFSKFGTLIAGVVLLIVGLVQSKLSPTFEQWVAYLLLIGFACVLFYSFLMALMTLAIWLIRVDNLWVLGETTLDVARFPTTIYERPVQWAMFGILPLGFLAMAPTLQLVGGADWPMVGGGLVWCVVAFVAARRFWSFALGSYGSASS